MLGSIFDHLTHLGFITNLLIAEIDDIDEKLSNHFHTFSSYLYFPVKQMSMSF